ncbi:YebC/PmpR family DNA-binding transcriptional regulator [candidate division WWE3 bacterium]|nr:YebC/PmpR family DNA-binding transcriptional regulator [candidate division WWE3 bacterium]
MSGHNKWSKIRHQKAVVDARKGKVFSKLSKKITVAAREGGGDPEMNPSLTMLIDKAKEANMPKDNIEKAIKKGTGELKGAAALERVVYEGYAPYGVALVIHTVTDNRNRTVAEIRNILEKAGGSLGTKGSASYIFGDNMEPGFEVPLEKGEYNGVEGLINELDDHDDVVDVYDNLTKS